MHGGRYDKGQGRKRVQEGLDIFQRDIAIRTVRADDRESWTEKMPPGILRPFIYIGRVQLGLLFNFGN